MSNTEDFSEFTVPDDTSYFLPDLIVESVLREAFDVLKRNPEIIDHIFRSLKNQNAGSTFKKYGQKELERIKRYVQRYDWSIVHSFDEVETTLPCVSIQLLSEAEAKEVGLEDYVQEATIPLTDEELAALTILSNIAPTGYNVQTGAISVLDSVDLTNVHKNNLFVDAAGNEYNIVGGINENPGSKQFMIAIGQNVDLSGPCSVKSAVNFKQLAIRNVMTDVNLLLGVHTKDALLTKYFYIVLKYFLAARKEVLIERGFICSKFQGSDFTRNLKFEGDTVFNRFLTLIGKVQDGFRSDETEIFDNFNIIVQVEKDQATTQDLGLQNQGIQVGPDSQNED